LVGCGSWVILSTPGSVKNPEVPQIDKMRKSLKTLDKSGNKAYTPILKEFFDKPVVFKEPQYKALLWVFSLTMSD